MESGGAERVVSTLSDELTKKGHKVVIVMVSAIERRSYYRLNSNVELIPLCEGMRKASNLVRRVSMLKNVLKEKKTDVVVAFLPHVCVYTWLALRNTNIPYILSERNDPNQYSKIYQFLIKQAFNKANACVFQTHDALSWYRNIPKDTDRVIFNIVGLTFVPEKMSNCKKKESVLFVGRLDQQKNYDLLLRTFKRFRELYPGYILDVYGDGPEKERFLSLISELGLQKHVKYHGKSTTWHMDEYNAGMYVSTSDYEGMSNSLEEAATLGIPCVATDCPIGGSAELAGVFNNIILCKVGDEDEFLNGMISAANMNCYFETINSRVSKDTIINEWLDLLSSVGKRDERTNNWQ